MKRSTSILAALILAVTVGGVVALFRVTEPRRTRTKLMELEGVDLRTLSGPARARMESLFNRFAEPRAAGIDGTPCEPLTVLRRAPDTAAERVLLVRTADIGGDRSVMLWYVDKGYLDGRIWEEPDSRGDLRIESIRAAFRPEVDAWCIEAVFSRFGERTRQFRFLLRDGRFALLRVEDEKARALPMPQGLRLYDAIGTAEEWASLLPTYQGAELVFWLAWLPVPSYRNGTMRSRSPFFASSSRSTRARPIPGSAKLPNWRCGLERRTSATSRSPTREPGFPLVGTRTGLAPHVFNSFNLLYLLSQRVSMIRWWSTGSAFALKFQRFPIRITPKRSGACPVLDGTEVTIKETSPSG